MQRHSPQQMGLSYYRSDRRSNSYYAYLASCGVPKGLPPLAASLSGFAVRTSVRSTISMFLDFKLLKGDGH